MTTPVVTRKVQSVGEKMEMTTPVITRKVNNYLIYKFLAFFFSFWIRETQKIKNKMRKRAKCHNIYMHFWDFFNSLVTRSVNRWMIKRDGQGLINYS